MSTALSLAPPSIACCGSAPFLLCLACVHVSISAERGYCACSAEALDDSIPLLRGMRRPQVLSIWRGHGRRPRPGLSVSPAIPCCRNLCTHLYTKRRLSPTVVTRRE